LRELIEQRLTSGYKLGAFSIPSIVEPIDWPAYDRPFAFHLHAWDPMSEVLIGHSLFGDERSFAAALCYARGWLERCQVPAFAIGPDPAALDAAFGPMPWYDMSVGLRSYRLAHIADVIARDPQV
jgi:hypothetical protein